MDSQPSLARPAVVPTRAAASPLVYSMVWAMLRLYLSHSLRVIQRVMILVREAHSRGRLLCLLTIY